MRSHFLCTLSLVAFLLPGCASPPAQAQGRGEVHAVRGDIIGRIAQYRVAQGDTLYGIARRFDLGIVELLAANPGTDIWQPPVGKVLTLPTAHVLPPVREGVVVNLAELRLYYFKDPKTVMTFPIGIGKEGWRTPTGTTTIVKKREAPTWIPPASIRAEAPNLPASVPPGPDNPLGTHALNLGFPGVVIHGTNRPYGIGKRSSHGCIRMYPEDIPKLFAAVPVGTKVTVIDAPYKLAWQDRALVLEASPRQGDADALIARGRMLPQSDIAGLEKALRALSADGGARIDWTAVQQASASRAGLPVRIGAGGP